MVWCLVFLVDACKDKQNPYELMERFGIRTGLTTISKQRRWREKPHICFERVHLAAISSKPYQVECLWTFTKQERWWEWWCVVVRVFCGEPRWSVLDKILMMDDRLNTSWPFDFACRPPPPVSSAVAEISTIHSLYCHVVPIANCRCHLEQRVKQKRRSSPRGEKAKIRIPRKRIGSRRLRRKRMMALLLRYYWPWCTASSIL
jgi:hypothetical protein